MLRLHVSTEKPAKGTLDGAAPQFQFHTMYKAQVKALSTSIIKAIYTKKNKKNIKINQISTDTQQPVILRDFVCFTFRRLFKSPTAHRHTTLLTEDI